MQKMLFFESIWSQRTMSWKMKTMLDKVPNRERVSNGISVDVSLLFGAGLCSAMFSCFIFQWYSFGIACYIVVFVCVVFISIGFSYSLLLVLFLSSSFYRCCIPSSKFMFLIYLYRLWHDYMDRLVIHVIKEHVSIENRST